MSELKKAAFKHIEAELYGFHATKKAIERRRQEIMTQQPEQDDNTGQGKNSARIPGRPTERMATQLVMDKRLRNLEEITEAIEYVYSNSLDNYKMLIELKYWKKGLTWDAIADSLHVTKRQAYRWRDDIVYTVAEVLGWR